MSKSDLYWAVRRSGNQMVFVRHKDWPGVQLQEKEEQETEAGIDEMWT